MPDARLFLGVFEEENDLLEAAESCRDAGYEFHDVYAPYAVHGVDKAMGLKRSKLTWVCFGAGLTGMLIGLFGQSYVTGVETSFWSGWSLNIGGKSDWPFLAFIPIIFELTILIAGLTTMMALFAVCKLYPGKQAKLIHPRVTDDRFVIALTMPATFDEARAREIFEKNNAEEIKQQEVET